MMNLYREEEQEKKSLSERFEDFLQKISELKDDIMLNIKTSGLFRNMSIKKVTKAIRDVEPNNTEKLKEIYEIINRLDLFDGRYGKQLDSNVYNEFLRKVEKNGSLNELLANAVKNTVCYRDQENGIEMK